MFKNLTTKQLVIKIVCFAVMVIVMVALIVGDSFAWSYARNIDAVLGISSTDFSAASAELQAGDKLVVELEEDGITLFKNKNNVLPLSDEVKNINVFGFGSTDHGFMQKGSGSGSSTISAQKSIRLYGALEGEVRDFDVEDMFENKSDITDEAKKAWGEKHLVAPFKTNSTLKELYNAVNGGNDRNLGSYSLPELNANDLTDEILNEALQFSPYAIFTVSRTGGENIGEIPDTYNELSDTETATLKKLRSKGFTIIVIINTANTMHLGWLDDPEINVDVCINVGLTGQSGARAIPEILRGKKWQEQKDDDGNPVKGEDGKVLTELVQLSPSGRFTDIVTKSNAVVKKFDPTWANRAPGITGGNGITYAEGIYYGYKWYETADYDSFTTKSGDAFVYDNVIQYPFGYGLSYAKFEQKIESVTYGSKGTALKQDAYIDSLGVGEEISVVVKVTNTSETYAGKDVVQLYYTPDYKGGIEKAYVNLLDFGKTEVIQPGESEYVTLTFTPYDMASYDCYDLNGNGFWGYELESGNYLLKLMNNSHSLIESYNLKIKDDIQIAQDPVTGAAIVNRFTGAQDGWENYNGSSYAELGTDGYEGGVDRSFWMTRSNFADTFPTTGARPNSSKIRTANEWMVDNELGAELPDFDSSNIVDSEFRIVKVATYSKPIAEIGPEDEPTSVDIATKSQLEGNLNANQKFEYDWDLIADLAAEYNSDIWETLLNQISLDEMKDLIELGGFHRVAVPSAGMPRLYDYDGPAGFNQNSLTGNWGGSQPDTATWTAYESEALIGCTWSKSLMLAMGLSMGAEANVTHVNGWYGPGVNLHRSNYTARNFEYYSEDGVLSGKLAAYVIAGAKINNLNCFLKHFVCSEEGPNPGDTNTWITEQDLRENFLRPFEIAVKEGGANSIMTAFNRVGASWAGANYAMNIKVLRGEWGFNGALITDYSGGGGLGGMYTRQGVRAGNDLWLNPSANSIGNGLNKSQDAKYIRNSAHNLLFTYVDTLNNYQQYQKYMAGEEVEGLEVSQQLAIQLAKYGMGDLDAGSAAQAYSWWKPVLIVIDVLVGLGFVVWALFLTGVAQKLIAKIKKTPAKEAVTAEGGSGEQTPEAPQEQTPADTPEENPETGGADES